MVRKEGDGKTGLYLGLNARNLLVVNFTTSSKIVLIHAN